MGNIPGEVLLPASAPSHTIGELVGLPKVKTMALIAAGSLLITACGGSSDAASETTEARSPVTVGEDSGDAASESTAIEEGTVADNVDMSEGEVLPGDDATIALEAANGVFQCGAEKNPGEWNVNFEPNFLLQESNLDLLESKGEVMKEKVGPKAFELLTLSGYDNPEAEQTYQVHTIPYVQLLSDAMPRDLQAATIDSYPTRENFRCVDTDNDGVGDYTVLRDIRSNEGADLLGKYFSVGAWDEIVKAAKEDGIDITKVLIHQNEIVTVRDRDGNEIQKEVVIAFFEDNDCGNLVFVSDVPPPPTPTKPTTPPTGTTPTPTTPTIPGVTTTTTPGSTSTTTTTPGATTTTVAETTVPDKKDDGKLPEAEVPADQDPGTPDVAGQGPAGQTPDEDGYLPSETPPSSQAPTTTLRPATTVNTVPATTGAAPTSTNAPVVVEDNPTVEEPETGDLPVKP